VPTFGVIRCLEVWSRFSRLAAAWIERGAVHGLET
jgi:hypothetical protein